MLAAKSLSKSFGAVNALNDLNLTVQEGETLCLLGANGAGKTTTINLFLGFLEPDAGEALIDGAAAHRDPAGTKAKLGYIPEQVALYPQLSGLENLDYFLRLAGVQAQETELLEALAAAGLERVAAQRKAGTYSKGMRQKVGIGVALAKKAPVLLLDEPLSGLDPSAANDLCGSLRQLRDNGCAILMATHDVFRAKEVGTKIGIMKGGRLVDQLEADKLDAREIEQIYLSHMHDGADAANAA